MNKIKAFRKWLQGKKTYILAFETIVEIVSTFFIGDQSIIDFMRSPEWNGLKAALAVIFVKNGIERKGRGRLA